MDSASSPQSAIYQSSIGIEKTTDSLRGGSFRSEREHRRKTHPSRSEIPTHYSKPFGSKLDQGHTRIDDIDRSSPPEELAVEGKAGNHRLHNDPESSGCAQDMSCAKPDDSVYGSEASALGSTVDSTEALHIAVDCGIRDKATMVRLLWENERYPPSGDTPAEESKLTARLWKCPTTDSAQCCSGGLILCQDRCTKTCGWAIPPRSVSLARILEPAHTSPTKTR